MLKPEAALALLAAWVCAVAWMDFSHRRIPNSLSLGAWVFGVLHLVILGKSFLGASPTSSLLAAGFAVLVTLPGYMLKQLGAGDVKFLVGIGLLSSWPLTLNCFVIGALLGAATALAGTHRLRLLMCLPEALRRPGSPIAQWGTATPPKRHIPFGTCLALGWLAALGLQ